MSKELAQVMFEAYNAQGPNPNKTWDGKDVPEWKNLGEQVTSKWRAAAQKAVELLNKSEGIVRSVAPRGGENMPFGLAIAAMQDGQAVTRTGWNGKGQCLRLQVPDANSKMGLPYIYIRTVDGKLVPWVASQTDLLARDWCTVD